MRLLLLILAVILLASCSTPRYTYHFDHFDYNSGKKSSTINSAENVITAPALSTLSTAINTPPANPDTQHMEGQVAEAKVALEKKYLDMSKAERKEFRKEVKKEFRNYSKAVKKGEGVNTARETSVMDNDLKLAIIFGAVGLTLTLFGGINEAFWILGVIAIVVGVVFLIKWLVRQ